MKRSLYDRIGGQAGIATLLRHFYADVRQHRLIGPVFNQRISDWPAHLATLGEFWARATGGPSVYSGQMPAKHFGLGLDANHFAAWLRLWECNCQCYCEPREAQEMTQLAHEIGKRLRSVVTKPPVELLTGSSVMKAESQSPLALFRRAVERWENEGGRIARVNIMRAPDSLLTPPSGQPKKFLHHLLSLET